MPSEFFAPGERKIYRCANSEGDDFILTEKRTIWMSTNSEIGIIQHRLPTIRSVEIRTGGVFSKTYFIYVHVGGEGLPTCFRTKDKAQADTIAKQVRMAILQHGV